MKKEKIRYLMLFLLVFGATATPALVTAYMVYL